MSVEFVAERADILERALKASGLKYTMNGDHISIDNGAITIDLKAQKADISYKSYGGVSKNKLQDKLNTLKQAYSLESIKTACTMHGWNLQGVSTKGSNVVGQMVKY